MRLAIFAATAALLSCSAAFALNPQPEPPGRHGAMTHGVMALRKTGGEHAAVMDKKEACRDAKGHFAKCPAPAAASLMATKHHPDCKKGKACGDSCIAMDKVCHK